MWVHYQDFSDWEGGPNPTWRGGGGVTKQYWTKIARDTCRNFIHVEYLNLKVKFESKSVYTSNVTTWSCSSHFSVILPVNSTYAHGDTLIVGYYNFDVDLRSGRRFVRGEGPAAFLPGTRVYF